MVEKIPIFPGIPCATVETTDGGCCVFPFVYNLKTFNGCTTEDSPLNDWCAKTANYDRDQQWGYCLCKFNFHSNLILRGFVHKANCHNISCAEIGKKMKSRLILLSVTVLLICFPVIPHVARHLVC